MRIKELHLENFRGFEKLDIVFPENSNVAVFIGENGSGKTTVLDAIRINLGFFLYKALQDVRFFDLLNEKDVKFGSDDFLNTLLISQGNEKDVKINSSIKLGHNSQGSFPDLFDIKNNENISIIVHYGSKKYKETENNNQLKRLQFLSFQNALNNPINGDNDLLEWIKFETTRQDKQRLKNRNFDYEEKNLKIVSDVVIRFLNEFSDNSFSSLHLETIELPKQNIFDFRTEDILIIEKDKNRINIDYLSSGEKLLLQLLADISRRLTLANPSLENPLKGNGIILIDEIDLHLHPKWQRNILPALTKTFPNVQFIVTTHSPQIVSSVPNESIFVLRDNQLINNDFYSEGRDANAILQDVFGIEKRPKEFSNKLVNFYQLLENPEVSNLEKAEAILKDLTLKWGTLDVEIIRATLQLQDTFDEIEL